MTAPAPQSQQMSAPAMIDILDRLAASQKACFDAGQHVAAMDIQAARALLAQVLPDVGKNPPAPGDVRAAVIEVLFKPRESDAIDNLEAALIDIKRLSAAGKPTDAVCIRTLERIQKQLTKVHGAIFQAPATDAAGGQS